MDKNIIDAIQSERDYQDRASADGSRPDIRQDVHMGDVLGAIKVNIDRAYEAWYLDVEPYPKTMEYLRKVAALCVRAGEVFGMPERPGPTATCRHIVKCPYCDESMPGILRDSKGGTACHCARYGKVGQAFCGEPVLIGGLCYDHAKACSTCHGPYDPNAEHVCEKSGEVPEQPDAIRLKTGATYISAMGDRVEIECAAAVPEVFKDTTGNYWSEDGFMLRTSNLTGLKQKWHKEFRIVREAPSA